MLRDVLESGAFRNAKSKVSVALGKNIAGDDVVIDLASMPHLLIAGTTGSGKSVCVNSLIVSLLFKATPEEVKLIMIDPKVVELSGFNGIPHLMVPVVTDPKRRQAPCSGLWRRCCDVIMRLRIAARRILPAITTL